jgi:transmembrane sensor
MDREHFRGILKKYLQGRVTPEEEDIIDGWYAEMGSDGEATGDKKASSALEKKYWSSIHSRIKKDKIRRLTLWKPIGIAAFLSVGFIAFLYIVGDQNGSENTRALEEVRRGAWTEILNPEDLPREITLPDGSLVILEPESQLKFSSNFNEQERAVYLSGEAFFDIFRNEGRPFLVHTSQLTTRVLGTSFRVIAIEGDKDVIVSVQTGKVSVFPNQGAGEMGTKSSEIILTPNQKIVYDKSQKKLSRMIVKSPRAIIPAEEVRKMRFENAPVLEIFLAIEKAYGVDIVVDEHAFSSCYLTTAISDGDIFNRLNIICNAIGARYDLKEGHILITGKGCDNQ